MSELNPAVWISLAGVIVVLLVHLCGTIWWGATITADVKALRQQSNEHASVRDLVIELRRDMQHFGGAITELSGAIKELRQSPAPRARRTTGA